LYEVFLKCQLILCFFLENECHIRLPSLNIRLMIGLFTQFVKESTKLHLCFNENPPSVYILSRLKQSASYSPNIESLCQILSSLHVLISKFCTKLLPVCRYHISYPFIHLIMCRLQIELLIMKFSQNSCYFQPFT
jgi:hypothetical protein